MKYYSQYRIHDLFELQESLSGLSKSNRWVKLADRLPWAKIEKEYNKRLRNSHCGAGNKPARKVNSEAGGEFERREDHPGHPGESYMQYPEVGEMRVTRRQLSVFL